MKKLLALLLVGAMSLSMVACGGAKEEAPAATETPAATEETAEAPAEEAGVAADITLWTYPVGKFNDAATVDEIVAAFNEVYASYITSAPARSCVAVKSLPKGALVEVEVIACKK